MDLLPSVIGFTEFRDLSFQEHVRLRSCVLGAMSDNLHLSRPLPVILPNRATLIGRFHHRAMELASKAPSIHDLDAQLDQEIEVLQREVDSWPHLRRCGSVSGWDGVNQAIAVAERATRRRASEGATVRPELTLRSRDGLLVGRLDLFTVSGTRGILTEYKTSSLRDERGAIRQEYVDQILFYSVLVFDNHAIEVLIARLESPRDGIWEQEVQRAVATDFKARIVNLLQEANRRISTTQSMDGLAQPSLEACTRCDKTAICSAFQRHQFEIGLTGNEYVLDGIVDELVTAESARTVELGLSSVGSGPRRTLRLPAQMAVDMKLGGRYVFTGLAGGSSSLRWTDESRIFVRD